VQNDHLETESERVAWRKGYDIGLAYEGEVPPLMSLHAMNNILARTAPPRNEGGPQAKRVAAQGLKQRSEGPLLDIGKSAVRQMLKLAKKRGYVTYDELDEVLPPEVRVKQIRDLVGELSEMGIDVVEQAHPLNEEPLQDKRVSTSAPKQQSNIPSLDLTDAAARRMIKLAKKRGYITHDELDEVLPSEEFTVEQIEDVIRHLSEMHINVVEGGEGDEAPPAQTLAEDDITEKEPEGGTLIPLVLQTLNDQSLSEGEKRAFALGLLRGSASRGE
jgi:hypothetical protein